MRRRSSTQLALARTAGWGGARAGAGRKPALPAERRVPHLARPSHYHGHPVHVTLRAVESVQGLRDCPVNPAVEDALRRASHDGFRVVHYTVQDNHLHLIIEAADRGALSRGLQGLAIRCARAINRALGRRGRVWAERYHARPLRTPSEVRRGLVYVLQNWRKAVTGADRLDPQSSARWFDGWRGPRPAWSRPFPEEVAVVRAARTWLMTTGWKRLGLIDFKERPRGSLD
jgi:REP element-mobilizing transposase RayT